MPVKHSDKFFVFLCFFIFLAIVILPNFFNFKNRLEFSNYRAKAANEPIVKKRMATTSDPFITCNPDILELE